MQLQRVHPDQVQQVYDLLRTHGWAHRVENMAQFTQLIAASQVADVAVIDKQVVGFVRGISDGLSNGYLSMLVVAAAQRRKGIGRQLVEHTIAANTSVTWMLRAGREGAPEFFAKLGFVASSIAMERLRTTPPP
ncbi:GNAT family N-acetyltransferase [Variovorax sp. HJSM1_2]|uniref:GNAT family N-acetyltransferase n=1 Tax=Variovorax sp. HJSM1_2 TaxID=3366263 RepID=UPI003BCBBA75